MSSNATKVPATPEQKAEFLEWLKKTHPEMAELFETIDAQDQASREAQS
jgi:hypothetical protein